MACLFDALSLLGVRSLGRATNIGILVGVGATPLVALTGAADWRHQNPRLRRTGVVHMGLNTAATICFLVSLRCRTRGRIGWGRVFSVVGYAIAGGSAQLGGSMAFDHELQMAGAPSRIGDR